MVGQEASCVSNALAALVGNSWATARRNWLSLGWRGAVIRAALSPAAPTYRKDGTDTVRKMAEQAAKAVKLACKESNTLILHRGPYLVASGPDESVPHAKPVVLKGRDINLFDADLPVPHSGRCCCTPFRAIPFVTWRNKQLRL